MRCDHERHHRHRLVDHDLGHARDIPGADPQQIRGALPVRMHDPVKIILHDIIGASRIDHLRQQLIADQGRRDREIVERHW
jgi:hypothetical protein